MEQITIAIRADGSAQIGMGHLMRCMSVANALKEKQAEILFITSNEQSKGFVTEKGFLCHMLQGQYESMEEEAAETLNILKDRGVCLFIVDSYRATEAYLAEMNSKLPVFYMDDLGRMNLPVSGLINYNIYGQKMSYEAYYPESVELILGSNYAPVKPEFSNTPYEVREKVTRILITMGGSDALNIAGSLGEALVHVLPQDVEITLICGRFSPYLDALKSFSEANSRVHVLTDVPDMWNQMAKSDLVIAAAGSTMYELCTMGVPTICCYYVENQRRIAECFGEETSMLNAGDYSENPENVLASIVREVQRLIADTTLRQKLSFEMKTVSDGCGARRIAEKVCNYLETK